jgi:serine/threonine protein kinase
MLWNTPSHYESVRSIVINHKELIYGNGPVKVIQGIDLGDDQQIAVKIVDFGGLSAQSKPAIEKEVRILQLAQGHPNVVKYKHHFMKDNKLYLVMEHAGIDLHTYLSQLKTLKKKQLRDIFRQIVQAVSHLHSKSISHGDIKLENIMINPKTFRICLADFGHSEVLQPSQRLFTMRGTPCYVAPEMVLHEGKGYDGFSSDMYSLGVVFYALWFGSFPFEDLETEKYYSNLKSQMVVARQTKKKTTNRISRQDLKFQTDKKIPAKIRDILCRLLSLDEHFRMSILELTEHEFVQQVEKKLLLGLFQRTKTKSFMSSGSQKI